MKAKTMTYYDWDDVQTKLCEYMGIEERQFRKYHEVVGGGYKDFWHVFLWLYEGSFKGNDTYFTMWGEEVQKVGDTFEITYEWKENSSYTDHDWINYKDWCKPLFDAIDQLHLEYGHEINVYISW